MNLFFLEIKKDYGRVKHFGVAINKLAYGGEKFSDQIERAIFAFSSNYFQNNKFALRINFKIDHADLNIANKLINYDIVE